MKAYPLVLLVLPCLVQCGSKSSGQQSSGDSGTDSGADGGDDATGSSSGALLDAGSSSGSDGSGSGSGSGSSGSGSGGGDGAVPTSCKTAMTHDYVSYTVDNTSGADVMTVGFDVDATWHQRTPMPAAWWSVDARDRTCPFASAAEIRLGGTIADADGGITWPSTALTWSMVGNAYPQSATDGAISLEEYVDPTSGTGNYWISKSGTIAGMPVGTECYELDFTNVSFVKDTGVPKNLNQATGSFVATGTARVGTGCP